MPTSKIVHKVSQTIGLWYILTNQYSQFKP